MSEGNELKFVGMPDVAEIHPELGADAETVAFCFDRVDEFTVKAKVAPEVMAVILGCVMLTRCKDCACCMKVDEHEYWCKAWGPMQLVRPDDFCSRGRRRKDE